MARPRATRTAADAFYGLAVIPADRAVILADVSDERGRQIKKWGVQDHASLIPILLERPGGCDAQRMCEEYEIPSEDRAKFLCRNSNPDTFAAIAIEELSEAVSCLDDESAMRTELVQLAAVCVAWIEAIDRRKAGQR